MSQATAMQAMMQHWCVNRGSMVRQLQRALVPFLSTSETEERLGQIEDAGILRRKGSESKTYPVYPTLNACLFDHPAFFEARETRSPEERTYFEEHLATDSPEEPITRYRIEQRITMVHTGLLDDALIQLWIPAPRSVAGVQRVRLLDAEPARLVEYYLPTAGQVYGAPVLIESGRHVPTLRMAF